MKIIEINNTIIVLERVCAIRLTEAVHGGASLEVFLTGSDQPLVIHGAGSSEYDRLKQALGAG